MSQSAVSPVVSTRASSRVRYGFTIFCGAFLLFQVQLILGKHILPWFGGTPAVWTTCMLFFQLLLLGGYLYSHLLSTKLPPRTQAAVHSLALVVSIASLLAGTVLWRTPILPGAAWLLSSSENPTGSIVLVLAAAVGVPYLLLSTTGPLLQSWFARAALGTSPYRLYALSNLGSLLGLLSYPFLFEPWLGLHLQAWLWCVGYVLFFLGSLTCAFGLKAQAAGTGRDEAGISSAGPHNAPRPTVITQFFWFLLPAFASVMLLATTNLICQDVAVVPFLWVLPLVLYLLSLIICFDNPRWYQRGIFHTLLGITLPFTVLAFTWTIPAKPVLALIAVFSVLLFACCTVCHGELVRLKPHPDYLTRFYLLISAGGAVGGVWVALVAPRIFRGYWEFHFGLISCVLLAMVMVARDRESWWYRPVPALGALIILGLVLLPHLYVRYLNLLVPPDAFYDFHYYGLLTVWTVCVAAIFFWQRRRPMKYHAINLAQIASLLAFAGLCAGLYWQVRRERQDQVRKDRNFYGSLTILRSNDQVWTLVHGKTTHGAQLRKEPRKPTLYFGERSGIGLWMASRPTCAGPCTLRYGLVGLGAGTLAAYGRAGEVMRFYEINPQVIAYSRGDKPYFTFLQDSAAATEVVAGDARLSLQRELQQQGPQKFDMLVLDAFSSDSIPVHLLTQEAFRIYLAHLRGPDSVLAFHVSNRVLDLRPVLGGLALKNRLSLVCLHRDVSMDMGDLSTWVLMARNPAALQQSSFQGHIYPMPDQALSWTDDYSNLFQILKNPW